MVASIFSRYEDFWVQHMMAEELGIQLPRGAGAALKAGMATTASFLFFGTIPLLGLMISMALGRSIGPQWYRPQFSTLVALALSASSLLLLGCVISRVIGSRTPIVYGMLMLSSGCAAAILALGLGQSFSILGAAVANSERPAAPEVCPTAGGRSDADTTCEAVQPLADGAAWPSFRRQFYHALCMLWVCVCSVVCGMQIWMRIALVEQMAVPLRVFGYGWLTCITTGLGAVPFLLIGSASIGDHTLATANAVACGMMLSASVGMLAEAHVHCGTLDWQILVGLAVGGFFIRCSEYLHGGEEEGEEDVVALHSVIVERRHWRKALLIFTVMFFHSAAEGVAVGVAFSRKLHAQFGIYVSLLLAVHNVPEGLAVALVLVPRGVSVKLAALIATLTSVPQPLLALVAFLFVDTFSWLLPFGLAFAAGAMVYVCLHELLLESAEGLGWKKALLVASLSFGFMSMALRVLQTFTGI